MTRDHDRMLAEGPRVAPEPRTVDDFGPGDGTFVVREPGSASPSRRGGGLSLGRLLVRDIIAELRARGAAVFLNSHLLGEVEATCDRVAFVKDGRVVHELALHGAAEDVEVEIRLSAVDGALVAGLSALAEDVARSVHAHPTLAEVVKEAALAVDRRPLHI